MQAYATARKHMQPHASSWNCMQAWIYIHSGTFWNMLEHSGTIWKILYAFRNILEHSSCFLEYAWTFCMHSGTFWNILHAFLSILLAFSNTLKHSTCILKHSAFILEHSPFILEHSVCILVHSGPIDHKQTDRQTLGLVELCLHS